MHALCPFAGAHSRVVPVGGGPAGRRSWALPAPLSPRPQGTLTASWVREARGLFLETQRAHPGDILNFTLPKVSGTNQILGQLSSAAEKPVAMPGFIIYSCVCIYISYIHIYGQTYCLIMTQSENTNELSYKPKKNIHRKINSCKEKKACFVVQINRSIRKEPSRELNCKAETETRMQETNLDAEEWGGQGPSGGWA